MAPEAVVFDLDGTLVDTERVWDVVRRSMAAEVGIEWREEYTVAMMGMSTAEWSRYLCEVVGLPYTPEEAARITVQGMVDHYRAGPNVLPGAKKAVLKMAERYPVAIASSSPPALIEAACQVLGISEVLGTQVSTEECERGKPAPDAYLLACYRLGVEPTNCVAVEDASNGIKAALAAGMAVISIPQSFHRPDEELLLKTIELASLKELTHELVAGLR